MFGTLLSLSSGSFQRGLKAVLPTIRASKIKMDTKVHSFIFNLFSKQPRIRNKNIFYFALPSGKKQAKILSKYKYQLPELSIEESQVQTDLFRCTQTLKVL